MALTRVLDVPVNRQREKADDKLIAEINADFSASTAVPPT